MMEICNSASDFSSTPPDISEAAKIIILKYYLSRFKDAYRQGTIDIMLGHSVSEDIFSENRTGFEEDSASTAEHVKLLIEDCKKMLISNPEYILGAWGLIDADPSSGDPLETEMDVILILTKDSYYVADYDDQIDKVTKYQRVLLEDVTLLEFGVPDISAAAALFKNTSKLQHHCIRINYKYENTEGYYHMFRSTNLRFFNNMAVVVKSEEEMIESLKAICEAFLVALDICGLPPVPFYQGQKLERRKSKTVGGHSTYLDISAFPHLTRNVSETQLLALKTVGTKALSNVSEQFSKLNRLGQSFNTKKSIKNAQAKFTVGKSSIFKSTDVSSSESDDDCDISIFQPQNNSAGNYPERNQLFSKDVDGGGEKNFNSSEVLEVENDQSNVKNPDTFLPSVGIVMSSNITEGTPEDKKITLINKENMSREENSAHVDSVCLSSIIKNVSLHLHDELKNTELKPDSDNSRSTTPEITISGETNKESVTAKPTPPNSLKLDRKLSHSSGEVDVDQNQTDRLSQTAQEFPQNISQSQSESALKQIKTGITTITSPVASATKDLVLSPFSKLAKGMQNLGANLDPRKIAKPGSVGGPIVRQITEREYEEHRKLQEKWRNCNTRLIALF